MLNKSTKNITLISIVVLLIISGCSPKKQVLDPEPSTPAPNWINQKPINSQYYFGIGKADKKYHTSNYQQVAKNSALEDIASEIEVKLDAQSVLFQNETSREYFENYQSTIKIEVTKNISGFEAVDSWFNENEYWVLYKLSKSKYAEIEAEKRNKSISKAIHYIDQYNQSENYLQKLEYLVTALKSVKPYLSQPIKADYNNSTIYLGDYTVQKIEELLDGIILSSSISEIDLNLNNCYQSNITWSLSFEDKAVVDFPVRLKFKTYSSILNHTDESGKFTSGISNHFFEPNPPIVEAWISISDIVDDQFIESLFKEKYEIKRIAVSQSKPLVYFESNRGTGMIENKINKSGCKITNNKETAELVFEFDFKTSDLGQVDEFYSSKCEIVVSVITNKNNSLIEKNWPPVKGVHLNKANAREKAVTNSLDQIDYHWFQQLITELCEN